MSQRQGCSKCGRPHTGLCGIPAGVTRGFGARIGNIKKGDYQVNLRPEKSKGLKTNTLDHLLAVIQEKKKELETSLRMLTSEMPGYNELQQDLEKVIDAIWILNRQIGERDRRR